MMKFFVFFNFFKFFLFFWFSFCLFLIFSFNACFYHDFFTNLNICIEFQVHLQKSHCCVVKALKVICFSVIIFFIFIFLFLSTSFLFFIKNETRFYFNRFA